MSTEMEALVPSSAPSEDLGSLSSSNQPSFSNQSESKDLFTMTFVAFENVLQDNTAIQQNFEETMEKFTVYLTSPGTSIDKIKTSCKYISSNFVSIRRRAETPDSKGHLRATRQKEEKQSNRNLAISFNEGDIIVEFEMSFTSNYVDVSDYNTRFLGWMRNNYATVGNELVAAGVELVDVTFIGYTNAPVLSTMSPSVSPSETPSTKPSFIPVSLLNALEESTTSSPTVSDSPTYAPTISLAPTTFQGYIQSEASKSAQIAIVLTAGCIGLVFLIRYFLFGKKYDDKKSLPFYKTPKNYSALRKKKTRKVIENDDDDYDDTEIQVFETKEKKRNQDKSVESIPLFPVSTSAAILDSSDDSDFVPETSKNGSDSEWEKEKVLSAEESSTGSWNEDEFFDPIAAFTMKKDAPQDRKSNAQQDVQMFGKIKRVEETNDKIEPGDEKPERPVTKASRVIKRESAQDHNDKDAKDEIKAEDVKPKRSATAAVGVRKRGSASDRNIEEAKDEIKAEDVKPKHSVTKPSRASKRRTIQDVDEMDDDLITEEAKDEIKAEEIKPKRPATAAVGARQKRTTKDVEEAEGDLSIEETKDDIQHEQVKPKRSEAAAVDLSMRKTAEDDDEVEDDLIMDEATDEIKADDVKPTRTVAKSSSVIKSKTTKDIDEAKVDLTVVEANNVLVEKDEDEIKQEMNPERTVSKVLGVSKSKTTVDLDDDISIDDSMDESNVNDAGPDISIAESFAASFLESKRKDLDIVVPPSTSDIMSERSISTKSPNSILKKDDEFEDLVAIVDKVLAGVRLPQKLSYAPRFRRATRMDMHAVHEFLSLEDVPLTSVEDLERDITGSRQHGVMPFYIIIEEKEEDGGYYMMGISLWSFGYSTWKGRIMNLDLIIAGVYEQYMMTCLAKIAQSLDCQRIEYRAPPQVASVFKESHGADLLSEWITLRIGRTDMTKFIQTKDSWSKKITNKGGFGWFGQNQKSDKGNERVSHDNKTLKESIDIITEEMNEILGQRSMGGSTSIRLRQATKYDARSMIEMVHELADFENAPNQVTVSSSTYKRDMTGPIPMFHCILVETVNSKDLSTEVVGYCVFFVSYSPKGKYLWLEDLFIQDDYRRLGCGKALMYILAQLALDRKYHSLLWQVLDWNKIALDFYEKLDVPKVLELEALRFDSEKMNQMLSKRSKSTKVSSKTSSKTTSSVVKEAR